MSIRDATHEDLDAIQRICLLTGDAGSDATGKFCDDLVLSDVYATPYLHGPGGFALVWEHDSQVVGYVLGTTNTRTFQEWFTREWWPATLRDREARTPADESLLAEAANPTRLLNAHVDLYPAHLHIDLLPQAQGQGAGRALMKTTMDLLRQRGIPALHLEVDAANHSAQGFYKKMGFVRLETSELTVTWGKRVTGVPV